MWRKVLYINDLAEAGLKQPSLVAEINHLTERKVKRGYFNFLHKKLAIFISKKKLQILLNHLFYFLLYLDIEYSEGNCPLWSWMVVNLHKCPLDISRYWEILPSESIICTSAIDNIWRNHWYDWLLINNSLFFDLSYFVNRIHF